ncbi:MAG: DUF4397 domain-containing protein [Bacteroidetes bacterium]|nr:DUF4397 domain-containing protein [Bacteroidota bacterium]
MRRVNIFHCTLLIVPALGILISACTKSFNEKTLQDKNFNNKSLVQVYLAMVNASRNYIYVDGNLITGSLMSSGSVFPSTAYAASIDPGVKGFFIMDTLSTSTQVPLSFAENMQVGKNYTIFVYDSLAAPKQKTVETSIVVPADTTARLRFANFTHTKTAIPGIDIFSKRLNQNLFTNINVSDVSGYVAFPSAFTDTLYVRSTGNTTNLVTLNAVNLSAKRSYTLVFRGSYSVTSGTAARTLSLFTNY